MGKLKEEKKNDYTLQTRDNYKHFNIVVIFKNKKKSFGKYSWSHIVDNSAFCNFLIIAYMFLHFTKILCKTTLMAS